MERYFQFDGDAQKFVHSLKYIFNNNAMLNAIRNKFNLCSNCLGLIVSFLSFEWSPAISVIRYSFRSNVLLQKVTFLDFNVLPELCIITIGF